MPPTDETPDPSTGWPETAAAWKDRYPEDDGFTARTLARLPPRRPRWRGAVLGAALGLALVTAALLAPGLAAAWADRLGELGELGRAAAGLVSSRPTVLPVTALGVVMALVVAVAILRDEAG